MPRGDNRRVWFPEMIEELRRCWSKSMSWAELAEFCACMTAQRDEIRRARGFQPLRMSCPGCGEESTFSMSGISIRSALFALSKNGIITEAELSQLDARWKKHRAQKDLDRFGREEANEGDSAAGSGSRHRCSTTSAAAPASTTKLTKDPVIAVLLHQAESRALARRERPASRNDACPCGSGKRYKHCCLR